MAELLIGHVAGDYRDRTGFERLLGISQIGDLSYLIQELPDDGILELQGTLDGGSQFLC